MLLRFGTVWSGRGLGSLDSPLARYLLWGRNERNFFPQDYPILASFVTLTLTLAGLMILGLSRRIWRGMYPESSALIAAVVGGALFLFSSLGAGGVFALLGGGLASLSGGVAWANLVEMTKTEKRRTLVGLGPVVTMVLYFWLWPFAF